MTDFLRRPGRPRLLSDGVDRPIYFEKSDLALLEAEAAKRGFGVNELVRRLIRLANIQATDEIELLKNDNAKIKNEFDLASEKVKQVEVMSAELAKVKAELETKTKEMDVLVPLKNQLDLEIINLKDQVRKLKESWWLRATVK